MPFKFKLKKSRQYNVSSKNLFVLSVELLDNTTVECTLSAQSLGQECLNNVCQRLGLQQYQYFGLRFLSKKGTFWWVDLKRPLKKQLDKYALESCCLYLGVMFFVLDVNILHDEVTRYHYFLQLKSDILEGKLRCTEDQMILFASYSLQAEFGDHDPERHTTEYLSNFVLLPKETMEGKQESVLERVILSHRSLQGMSQQLAEVYYIMEAQHLSGYGLECFTAKDHSGNAIILGVSLMGIYIWYLDNQPYIYFSWNQIVNLVHHKRCFSIELRNNSKVLQIYLVDSHLSKYVWKICILQHGFYTKNEGYIGNPSTEQSTEAKLLNISPPIVSYKPSAGKQTESKSQSQNSMQESQESLDGLGIYHTNERYSETVQSSNCLPLEGSQMDLTTGNSVPSCSLSSTSNSSLSTVPSSLQSIYSQSQYVNCGKVLPLRRASSSDASIHRNLTSIQESAGFDSKCSALPLYRQAPDYNTAIKLKYGIQSCSTGNVSACQQPQSAMSCVSPVNNDSHQSNVPVQSYSHYKNYSDLSHLNINDGEKCDTQMIFRRSPAHTYSSPDLAVPPEGARNVMYHFKLPPPYPYKQSSSTPDLTRSNMTVTTHPSLVTCQDFQPSNISYKPTSVTCAKVVTSNPIHHQTIASSQRVGSQNNLPIHSYENYNPTISCQVAQPINKQDNFSSPLENEEHLMGPMLIAAMNGLSLSKPNLLTHSLNEIELPNDTRIQALETHLADGQIFLEFERIPKKKPNADFSTALLPENAPRNRFKDVFPYEENRVRLTPTSENKTGYINASHLTVSLGLTQRFYIAAQGPLPNTLYSFWQMIWEHHVMVIVMLTEVQEQGCDKCFPYWPQEDGNKIQIGEFQITRNFSMSSSTYVTCSLTLCHVTSHQQRSIWHIQYTDWPDHSCPHELQGFIAFMNEVDAVRRHSENSVHQSSSSPVVIHCSAGVGRSGAVLLCDIMLYCLDHNQAIDVPKVLTHLRFQRMLTVQTLAQYKFVYTVLIQYLKNSRLI